MLEKLKGNPLRDGQYLYVMEVADSEYKIGRARNLLTREYSLRCNHVRPDGRRMPRSARMCFAVHPKELCPVNCEKSALDLMRLKFEGGGEIFYCKQSDAVRAIKNAMKLERFMNGEGRNMFLIWKDITVDGPYVIRQALEAAEMPVTKETRQLMRQRLVRRYGARSK